MTRVILDDEPFSWMKEIGPEFSVKSNAITFLDGPERFFSFLNSRMVNAARRITVASLYFGTGHLEHQLLSGILHALQNSGGRLCVQILLDFTRGSRGLKNSRTILLPLLRCGIRDGDAAKFDVRVALYHTPDLRGLLKRILPDRWNEIIGLSHMKIYIVDDTAIISGANFSEDYFINRQDRYVIFEDGMLANFFDDLVSTVASFSLQLQSDNSLSLCSEWKIHPFNDDRHEFKREAQKSIRTLLERWKNIQDLKSNLSTCQAHRSPNEERIYSKVFPLIQMAPFSISQDSEATETILKNAPEFSRIYLASGYFNLTSHYEEVILKSSAAQYTILTAAPRANGFFKAKGLPGFVPYVYTYIAKQFYEKLLRFRQTERIFLFEYGRPQWTFHAKGMWYYLPNASLPLMTLIGSPNFGHRSVHRDLEVQVAIVTKNHQLQQEMHLEQKRLYSNSTPVASATFLSPERAIGRCLLGSTFVGLISVSTIPPMENYHTAMLHHSGRFVSPSTA